MKNKCILKKCAAILALTVFSAFTLVACSKEPKEHAGSITMTTKASKVEFLVVGTGNIVIDWGDGKKSNLNDALYDEPYKQFVFTHDYSGANPRYIAITGNITRLDCSNNELTALNVSGSTELTELNCDFNQLTALDVNRNTALTYLICGNNQLTALDVSKNTALISLSCNNNQLKKMNLSAANIVLVLLRCKNNQLTVSALNDLFRALPDVTENEYNPGGGINITGNPGESDCDRSIAQKKGWEFSIRL